ncbi:MAG: SUMF1/EgtB/PvdO family nonheme iron enzyme [Myxococcota bacterium]
MKRACLVLLSVLACVDSSSEEPAGVTVEVPRGVQRALGQDGFRLSATMFIMREPCPPPGGEGGPETVASETQELQENQASVNFAVEVPTRTVLAPPGPGGSHCARVVYTASWEAGGSAHAPWQRAAGGPLRVAHQDGTSSFTLMPYANALVGLAAAEYGGTGALPQLYDVDGDNIPNLTELELALRPQQPDDLEPPAGTTELPALTAFCMGQSGGDTLPSEGPEVCTDVGALRVDKLEVTNRQYRVCLGKLRPDGDGPWCTEPVAARRAEDGELRVLSVGSELLPVVGVTLEQAATFCAARGMRLPSELEWERAARTPGADAAVRWTYPWGSSDDEPELENGNNPCTLGRFLLYTPDFQPEPCVNESVMDVGPGFNPVLGRALRVGINDLSDLAGNVAEWTSTPFHLDAHEKLAQGPLPPSRANTVRGGSYQSGPRFVRGYARSAVDADEVRPEVLGAVGIRCVADR